MAPTNKTAKAIEAMELLGFREETVRPVLKDVLKSCKRKWALIENGNYATLVDAIIQSEIGEKEKGKELLFSSDNESEYIEPSAGRSKSKHQTAQSSAEASYHKKRRSARKPQPIWKPIVETNLLPRGYPSVKEGIVLNENVYSADSEYNNFMIDISPSPKEDFPVPLPLPLDEDGFNNFLEEDYSRSSGTNLALEMMNVDEEFDALPSPPRESDGESNEPGNGSSMITRSGDLYYIEDITRGREKQNISLINEVNSEELPTFIYLVESIPYCKVKLNFPLIHISVNDCCSNCTEDCLSMETPCPCAKKSGGEFAYKTRGVVKDAFIDECISRQCNGHVIRKFIKECWYKCECSMDCGNRTIQRGITVKLQVFMTKEGKGWGLRTLEDLPKGAFISEYVGEVITSMELAERNMQQQSYNVILDAGELKDEEALCLDGSSYGNVARFINHRCEDANMIEIPIEVESPDHHYYHVAFFTTREVKAQEELTWDYGINFGDDNQPRKAFQCLCGSNFCRGKELVKISDVSAGEPCSDREEGLQSSMIQYSTTSDVSAIVPWLDRTERFPPNLKKYSRRISLS